MSNMSYCRFQNTLNDLRDCHMNMDDPDSLSPDEKKAREQLLQTCAEIINDFGHEIDAYITDEEV